MSNNNQDFVLVETSNKKRKRKKKRKEEENKIISTNDKTPTTKKIENVIPPIPIVISGHLKGDDENNDDDDDDDDDDDEENNDNDEENNGNNKKEEKEMITGVNHDIDNNILESTVGLYVEDKMKMIKREIMEKLLEIEEKLDIHDIDSNSQSSKIDYKMERNLLNKWFKVFLLFVLFLFVCCLVGVDCVILLNGLLWMGIPNTYCILLVLMHCGVIGIPFVLTIFIYYIMRVCCIKKRVNKYQMIP